MIFVLTNVIYIVYDRKNENHWSLLITHYSLLGIQTPFSVAKILDKTLIQTPASRLSSENSTMTGGWDY